MKNLQISNEQYKKMAQKASPPTNVFKNCVFAFLVGGLICVLGELSADLFVFIGADIKTAKTFATITLIFLAALFTGIGIYDDIAKKAGAGTLVPITGFSNAIVSPAIEYKTEGFIFGVGAKMFTIAGPVIVYGTVASIIYGLIYWITTLF